MIIDKGLILGICAGVLSLVSLGVILYALLAAQRRPALRNLMQGSGDDGGTKQRLTQSDFDLIKAETKRAVTKKTQLTMEDKLFQAGILDPESKSFFLGLRFLSPFLMTIIG